MIGFPWLSPKLFGDAFSWGLLHPRHQTNLSLEDL
jgi:hypothetical protein